MKILIPLPMIIGHHYFCYPCFDNLDLPTEISGVNISAFNFVFFKRI